jgi:hypothetical protein
MGLGGSGKGERKGGGIPGNIGNGGGGNGKKGIKGFGGKGRTFGGGI